MKPTRSAGVLLAASVLLGAASVPACGAAGEEDPSDSGEEAYSTSGTCDGLPRLRSVETPPGVCVGVASSGLKRPRGIVELPSGDLLLADMGGWGKDLGSVWILRRHADKTFSRTRILAQIDKPSGVAVGPDGLPYVGTPKDIFRFDPYETVPRTGKLPAQVRQPRLKQVVKGLPGLGRHPLQKFVFDPTNPWTLYVNVGSASDVCEQGTAPPPAGFPAPCPEAEGDAPLGAIRKYVLDGPDHVATTFTTHARGLRNSMALAVHPTSGILLQAENSRDKIHAYEASYAAQEVDLPHEELNIVLENGHYGWPYCFDNGTPNPEYRGRVDCTLYTNPTMLLPGHAAPLGMTYYTGDMFPAAYRRNLLVAYHGYRELGHRLVVVPVDDRGVPAAPPLDVIRRWEPTADGKNPQGAPVDVLVAKDGALYVTEDKNGTVLRVVYEASRGDGKPMAPLPLATPVPNPEEAARCADVAARGADAFTDVQRMIEASCTSCHGVGPGYAGGLALLKCDPVGNAARLSAPRRDQAPYVVAGKPLESEVYLRMIGQGYPQMPAGGAGEEGTEAMRAWIAGGAVAP